MEAIAFGYLFGFLWLAMNGMSRYEDSGRLHDAQYDYSEDNQQFYYGEDDDDSFTLAEWFQAQIDQW
jgi:hypothetical protein